MMLMGQRRSAVIDGEMEFTDASEIAKAAWTPVASSAYENLRLGSGTLCLVWGEPGAGKSTFAALLLNGLKGHVVYQSLEEGLQETFQSRITRLRIRRKDFGIAGRSTVDQLADKLRKQRSIGLVVDSAQLSAYTPEDLRHLLIVIPTLKVVVAVSQVNADGAPEGRKRLFHECDVAVECSEMRWTLKKSRHQPTEPEVGGAIWSAGEGSKRGEDEPDATL